MKKLIIITVILAAFHANCQKNTDGQYSIGILPATSSAQGGYTYLTNMQAVISSVFTGKSRFTVVDRSKFEQIASERNLQKQEEFLNSNMIVEQGKSLGAQFLVAGNISQLSKSGGYVERTRYVIGSDKKLYPQVYNVYVMLINITLNIQVVDVETGMVKANNSVSGTTKTETMDEQIAISNAVAGLESSIKGWVNEAFPVYMRIIKIESSNRKGMPETVLIKGGDEMDLSKRRSLLFFSESSELMVFEKEKLIIDGKEYNRDVKVGIVKISEVQGDFSICKVKNGAESIKNKIEEGKTLLLKIISY